MQPLASQWLPYCGAAPLPAEWLGRWNFDPILVLVLLAMTLVGWRALSGDKPRRRIFLGAMAALAVLFVSPLCALTSALFSARAVHHALLVAAAAPLLAWALPVRREAVARTTLWTIAHAAVFWAWHVPALYEAALASDAVYWLMQLTLLGSAVGFWLAVRRAAITSAVAALLGTMVQMGLLGALLTFAPAPLYAPHFATTSAWGLSPLEDQQLAGLIMWAPAAALYLLAALLLAGRWLQTESRAAAR